MARVTVEDCAANIPNRFELVLVAANRSKKLSRGIAPLVKRDNDKNPVLALREIAYDKVLAEDLQTSLIASMQKVHFDTEVNQEDEQSLDLEKDWSEQIAQLSRELESLGSVEENLEDHMQIETDGEESLDVDDIDEEEVFDIDENEE
jgi:DNA-directed RNA polymerase subunit omega